MSTAIPLAMPTPIPVARILVALVDVDDTDADASVVDVLVPECETVPITMTVAVVDALVPLMGKYGRPNVTLNLFLQQLDPSLAPQHHSWSWVAIAVPAPQSKILAKLVRSASSDDLVNSIR